jgi:hypothetical protein
VALIDVAHVCLARTRAGQSRSGPLCTLGTCPSHGHRASCRIHTRQGVTRWATVQAFCELWESWADRCRPEMDDAVHAAALSGLKDQLAHDGDEGGAHAAEVCERDLVARLGFNGVLSSTPRRRRALPCAHSRPTARQRGHAPAPGCGWGWQPVGARTGDGRRATLHALLLVLGLSLFCPDPRNPYFVC